MIWRARQAALETTRERAAAASARVERMTARVTDLELQQRELGGQAVSEWRRDIADYNKRIAAVEADLAKLAAALTSFGLADGISFADSHHSAEQWGRIKTALKAKAEAVPQRTADLDAELARLSAETAALEGQLAARRTDIEAAERARSNLPGPLIEVRERLAETLGVSTAQLPFFGELVRVSPSARQDGWEGALNRLLGNRARRLLVPERLYAAAARAIDGRHLGLKLEYDRVDLVDWQESPHGPDRAAGKLEVRRDSDFAGHVRAVLDQRFDHTCFEIVDHGFRQARRAVTKAGQSRDGDRHIKDDRRRVDDRSAYVLGWDTAERVAYLRRDLRRLEADSQTLAEGSEKVRNRRDGLVLGAGNMRQLADGMGRVRKR